MTDAEIKAIKSAAWAEGFAEALDDYTRKFGAGNPYLP